MSTEREYSPGKRLEAVQETLVRLLRVGYIPHTNESKIEGVEGGGAGAAIFRNELRGIRTSDFILKKWLTNTDRNRLFGQIADRIPNDRIQSKN